MKLKQNDVVVFFGDSVTDTCHQVKARLSLWFRIRQYGR